MRRALTAALTVGALVACPAKQPEPRAGLHVPLPEGWHATPVGADLHVGPGSRVVLELEPSARALPSLDELVSAATRERVIINKEESTDTFVGVRYQLGDAGVGFLGVHRVGPRTVWCASTRELAEDEADAAAAVCRGLDWDS